MCDIFVHIGLNIMLFGEKGFMHEHNYHAPNVILINNYAIEHIILAILFSQTSQYDVEKKMISLQTWVKVNK